jgi:GNAT superfamily N-acetyltransferase
MYWRLTGKQHDGNGNEGNREALRAYVEAGAPVGVLAYVDGVPAGWSSVAPREKFGRIVRSTTLQLDNAEMPNVWSITCFFVHREYRRQGLTAALAAGALRYAVGQGAAFVEGYPVDTEDGKRKGALHGGTTDLFSGLGFEMTRLPKGRRVIMRYRARPMM